MRSLSIPLLVVFWAAGQPKEASLTMNAMDEAAISYVKLVLAMGPHDKDYVDAYFGPEQWKREAESALTGLGTIRRRGAGLFEELRAIDTTGEPEMIRLRHRFLTVQLAALLARAAMLSGERLSFDQEARALYDADPPSFHDAHFQEILDELDRRLPGSGPLLERYEQFRSRFFIPRDQLDAVFQAAIDEARERTKRHIDLPASERFRVEYVTDKSWSGYNWYQGSYESLIQVNTDLPITIDRAVDLACHEGYPGHHVYNVVRERELVNERGWLEFTVHPLFSPMALISEGSANFGIDVAFPDGDRIEFERERLFPLAGLDPGETERYYEVLELVSELDYAGNEAARRYLNGEFDAASAADWLTRHALKSLKRARQSVRFYDQYRSYVINYNLGRDLVEDYIEARGGTAEHPERRWQAFEALISSPRLPSDLTAD